VNQFAPKLIKSALSSPKTREELLRITKLPERTLRYHLAILKKKGLVKEALLLDDLRKKVFSWSR
jgi:DNA-binding transcriptional ArsR family regulator